MLRDAIIHCTGDREGWGNVLQVGLAALFGLREPKKKTEAG